MTGTDITVIKPGAPPTDRLQCPGCGFLLPHGFSLCANCTIKKGTP